MERKSKNQRACNHCEGTMAFNGETYSCLMCGRDMNHECEYCMGLSTGRKRPRKTGIAG